LACVKGTGQSGFFKIALQKTIELEVMVIVSRIPELQIDIRPAVAAGCCGKGLNIFGNLC
jgi:hypothetical protein